MNGDRGKDMIISDQAGREVLRCEGKFMSNRKRFISPAGLHLFDLRKDGFSVGPPNYVLEAPTGQRFASINSRRRGFSRKTQMQVNFNNTLGGGREEALQLRTDGMSYNADLTWNGQPVALIRRQAGMFKSTYGAQVGPGVDLAFVSIS